MKSNNDLAKEIIEHVKAEMKNTRIYELEFSSRSLPISRVLNIIKEVKEILSYDFFVGDSKDNNLLVWKRDNEVNEYVINNLV